MTKGTWVSIALGVVAIGGSAGVAVAISGPSNPAQHTAVSNCQWEVKQELTAPATAHFHDQQITSGGPDGGWTIAGEVDSENSFGALLTSTYSCTTDYKGMPIEVPTVSDS